jgi:hypothetical protein
MKLLVQSCSPLAILLESTLSEESKTHFGKVNPHFKPSAKAEKKNIKLNKKLRVEHVTLASQKTETKDDDELSVHIA